MKYTLSEIKLLKILILIELYRSVTSYIYPDSFYFSMLHILLIYFWGTIVVILHLEELNYILMSVLNFKHFIMVISSIVKKIVYSLLKRREYRRIPCPNNQRMDVQNEGRDRFALEPLNYHEEGIKGKSLNRIVKGQEFEVIKNSLPIQAKKLLVRWANVDEYGLYTAGFLVIK